MKPSNSTWPHIRGSTGLRPLSRRVPQCDGMVTDRVVAALVSATLPSSTPTWAEPAWAATNQSPPFDCIAAMPTDVDTAYIDAPARGGTTSLNKPCARSSCASRALPFVLYRVTVRLLPGAIEITD